MKKIICVFMFMFVLLTLVGCAKQEVEKTSYIDELKYKDKIVVGISPDYYPFEALSTSGEVEGFDIDFLNALVSYLDEDIEIELATMEFDNIVTAVQMGQVDIGCSGFTYDPDRDVIFSTPYAKSAQAVVVSKDANINSIEDLKDKTIGGQMGTTGLECAENIEGTKEVVSFADCMIGLSSIGNSIDGFVADYGVAKAFALANDMIVLEETLADEEMSIIIKNGNELLEAELNKCIEQFLASDEYEQFRIKWGI